MNGQVIIDWVGQEKYENTTKIKLKMCRTRGECDLLDFMELTRHGQVLIADSPLLHIPVS